MYPTPDEYLKTDCFITIVGENGAWVYRVERTGICMPGPWAARAVYRYQDEYYVYEGGWLIPSKEWHAEQVGKYDVRLVTYEGVSGYIEVKRGVGR